MSEPYYVDPAVTVYAGDCLDVLRELPDASVDAVVTDPPYGLGFMGKEWDKIKQEASRPPSADVTDERFNNKFPRTGKGPAATAFDGVGFQAWCLEWTAECLRVLKPGGHMLAFGGTRTSHRLACAIEDAGFEIRDSIAWLYGSGFPKSLDVSKAIDRAAGAEREVVATIPDRWTGKGAAVMNRNGRDVDNGLATGEPVDITAPATADAARWQGWGTALKPAHEPIVVARKPLAGTVAANVLTHGTGALNVDGCRVGNEGGSTQPSGMDRLNAANASQGYRPGTYRQGTPPIPTPAGRWPANVVLDESQAEVLDEQSGGSLSRVGKPRGAGNGEGWGMTATGAEYDDQGGASRFFYVAKADSGERVRVNGTAHPTVKPLALMRWLVRLVTPPGGTVLEPFAGSGTTVEACLLEGFACIAIEREADYLPLIHQRINRRRDPVEAVKATGDDGGLFDLLGGEPA